MAPLTESGFGNDLRRAHHAITRGIDVSREHAAAFARGGGSEPTLRSGYGAYVHSLASLVHGHHSAEEQTAFPYLREHLPDDRYDKLLEQHHGMLPLIEQLLSRADRIGAEEFSSADWNSLHDTLTAFSSLWREHIGVEESILTTERLQASLTPDEQRQLSQALAQYALQHAEPTHWIVPFVLYNLVPEERAVVTAMMPPQMVNELVPRVWLAQWTPMKPFLLE